MQGQWGHDLPNPFVIKVNASSDNQYEPILASELRVHLDITDNQDNFITTSTVYVEQAYQGTALRHMIAEISTSIDLTHIEVDSLILLRVFRDATHANDTLTDTAYLLKVDAHFETDRVATKNRSPNFYV